MTSERDPALKYFARELTDSERAAFEAGIALATALHQLVGIPLPRNAQAVKSFERAIEKSLLAQPYRRRVEVRIRTSKVKRGPYGYSWVDPRNLSVSVTVKYGSARVTAVLRWVNELQYPLMYVKEVER